MDNTSLAYREGKFPEIFEAARSNRLREDQVMAYSESLQKLRDTRVGIAYASEKAREEGRAEGELMERKKSIRLMLSFGIPAKQIADQYGISVADVLHIADSHCNDNDVN